IPQAMDSWNGNSHRRRQWVGGG
ncbi:hypothetical protein A2U01_0088863, partial [Trifolium medium]|nr:hypothetical protein [Trifolium medium]